MSGLADHLVQRHIRNRCTSGLRRFERGDLYARYIAVDVGEVEVAAGCVKV